MPSYPVVEDGSPLFGGPVPVSSIDDVKDVLPASLARSDSAPVRDAILAAVYAIQREYQKASAYAAAQSDPTRSSGIYLDGQGSDRGIARNDPSDTSYRSAIFAPLNTVTVSAIANQVNELLSAATPIQCQIADATLDSMYITDSVTNPFQCFVGTAALYLDRLYQSDATRNGGVYRPNSAPGGFLVFDGLTVRTFLVRIPDLTGLNANTMFVAPDTSFDEFIYSNVNPNPPTVSSQTPSAVQIYNQILGVIESVKEQGYRFVLLSDPSLTS